MATDRAPNVPVQVFLVLFPAAVGCLLGSLVIDSTFGTGAFAVTALTAAVVFAVAGAVAPLLGIKKPPRSYRFLSGLNRSPLSRQALLVGLFTVLLMIHWALVLAANGVFALGVVAAAVGGAAVFAIGLTYHLKSQPSWLHWSTLVSLFGGTLAVGVAAALVAASPWRDSFGESAGVITARVLVLVGLGGLVLATVERSLYLSRGGHRTQEIWTLTWEGHRGQHLSGAILVVVAAAAAAVAFAWPWAIIIAFISAGGAQVLQWRLFFVTGIPLSWKSEVRWSVPLEVVGKEG